ncbi:hypothetical protein CR513_25737, partial [Mucuna pruriens]
MRLPYGSQVLISIANTIYFSNNFLLTNVLYMPSFTFNLIFVSRLVNSIDYKLIFSLDIPLMTSWSNYIEFFLSLSVISKIVCLSLKIKPNQGICDISRNLIQSYSKIYKVQKWQSSCWMIFIIATAFYIKYYLVALKHHNRTINESTMLWLWFKLFYSNPKYQNVSVYMLLIMLPFSSTGCEAGTKGYLLFDLKTREFLFPRMSYFMRIFFPLRIPITLGLSHVYPLARRPSDPNRSSNHKAKLVSKGFTQTAGLDYYLETFNPIVNMKIIGLILALTSSFNLYLHQLGMNNTFLHGNLFEEVYMKAPLGLTIPAQYGVQICKNLFMA